MKLPESPTEHPFSLTPVRGQWYCRVRLEDGTRPGFKVGQYTGPDKMSEERAREKVRAWIERGLLDQLLAKGKTKAPAPKTIADVVNAWCPLVEKSDLAPATRKGHTAHANGLITDRFGTKTPEQVTTPELRAWLRELRESLSGSRTRNVFFTLSKMLDDAIAEGWISIANPCRHPKVREELPAIETPEDEDKAHHTEAEAATLIASTTAPERRLRYLLAFTTGMRDGELAGLRWSDLEEEHGIGCLKVRGAIAKHGDDGYDTRRAPKTKTSRRTVPVHPLSQRELERWKLSGWRAYVGRDPKPEDPILPSPRGEPWRPHSAELLRADLEAAGLPSKFGDEPFEFRSTRRSFATWLEAHDVSADHADRLLGHSGQSVRRRHYSAADVAALARAVATIALGATPAEAPVDDDSTGPEKPSLSPLPMDTPMDTPSGQDRVSVEPPSRLELETYGLRSRPTPSPTSQSVAKREPGEVDYDETGRAKSANVHDVSIDAALAVALTEATKAGRWDVVSQLARELEARRLAGSNVVPIASRKAR